MKVNSTILVSSGIKTSILEDVDDDDLVGCEPPAVVKSVEEPPGILAAYNYVIVQSLCELTKLLFKM